jgi:hypothetical protein
VFVFPEALQFDQQDPKLVLTLYNPYQFPISFKVLCSAPHRYAVGDAEGSARPGKCVDIVVRHKAVTDSNLGKRDKFRVDVFSQKTQRKIGSKEIYSQLSTNSNSDASSEVSSLKAVEVESIEKKDLPAPSMRNVQPGTGLPVWILAIACIFILFWPEDSSTLHITVNHKMVAVFILGLVVMAILKG